MAEIVGMVANLLGIGKCIVEPIKHQFDYLCCFDSNIQSLRDEAKKLDDAKAGLEMQVAAAANNAEVILPEVETWLTNANQIQIDANRIETEIPNVQSGCLSIKSRRSLCRKAKKTTEAMKELRNCSKFNRISVPTPSAARELIKVGATLEFDSRKQLEEDIMIALRGKNVDMMGICGMGGVGKTTLAKRIMHRVREENIFDEIVMVVVSQQVDILRVQREIAELLGLKLDVESLSARAHKLYMRLMGTKRILMVFDDVWERLKLEDIGIPCEAGFKWCTILLTSRNRDVFYAMDAQKVFAIQTLNERESWFLFKETAGNCVDDLDFLSIASEVAKECKGLPIALITVGRALKDKKIKSTWLDALQQLKSSNPIDMPQVLIEVYNPLKLSYDFLDNQHSRSLFLLCSLFPEDHNIPIEYLTLYVMGLRMFEGTKNLEEVRNRTCTLVEMLKSRFLLLDGRDEHHIKMHDIVRDVAIFIASKEGRVNLSSVDWSRKYSYDDCTWISLTPEKSVELPMELIFPSLRLLLIDNSGEVKQKFGDSFFQGMSELNVLSIRSMSLKSLPYTIQLLKNLQTLQLHDCMLDTISIISELSSLEILSCRDFPLIEELPAEIGRLNRLRLLEFSYCENLKIVAPGVISNLIKLEELKMVCSFKGWELADVKGKKRRNVSLNELESLSNLTCLEIEIEDWTSAAEEILLSPEIVKYDINIGHAADHVIEKPSTHGKRMQLRLERDITLGNWIQIFLRSAEGLYLEGDGSSNVYLSQFQNLKSLHLEESSTVTKVVDLKTSPPVDWRFGVFPVLESLWLVDLPNLEEICDGEIPEGSNSFGKLKKLRLEVLPALKHTWKNSNQNVSLSRLSFIMIDECDNLHSVFSLTRAKDCLLQLEDLEIQHCEMMEEVFWNEGKEKGGGESRITFPKLRRLKLCSLPRITNFCRGIESIEFPVLTNLHINNCPELISVAASTGNNQILADDHANNASFHLFCNQQVALGSLKTLHIQGYEHIRNAWCHQIPIGFFHGLEKLEIIKCQNISCLFSSSVAVNLVNLKELTVERCGKMIKVIADEKVSEKSPFPNLELLKLTHLDKLEIFCQWRNIHELPSLKQLRIVACPLLESLLAPKHLWKSPNHQNVSLCNLSSIVIDGCDMLRNLFPLSLAKDCLLQLELLSVASCWKMEEVFWHEENENNGEMALTHVTFPKLKTLKLHNMSNPLTTFCRGIESVGFPLLTEMRIEDCPQLISPVSSSIGNNHNSAGYDDNDDDDSFHFFCKQKVAFGNLKNLYLTRCCYDNKKNIWCHHIPVGFFNGLEKLDTNSCDNITSLFSYPIAANLVNLKILIVGYCWKMVKVIEGEEEVFEKYPFPRLEELRLTELPKLEMFCEWRCDLELPSLKQLLINKCPKLEHFTLGSLSTPKLAVLEVDHKTTHSYGGLKMTSMAA